MVVYKYNSVCVCVWFLIAWGVVFFFLEEEKWKKKKKSVEIEMIDWEELIISKN